MDMTLPFQIRQIEGRVRIGYGRNDDPARWGFDILGLPYDIGVARGFPVLEASVEYPPEGYAAFMSWIQLVRQRDGADKEPTVMVDLAPQLRDARMPFVTFGVRPTLFDAPAFVDGGNVVWRASSFLTYSPDGLMTPVVEPACGFGWGYDIREGIPEPIELTPAGRDEWLDVRAELRRQYPEWTFRGDDWEPPPWPSADQRLSERE